MDVVQSASAVDTAQALSRFLSTLWAIDSINCVGFIDDGSRYHLWALMSKEILEDAERVFLAGRALQSAFPVTLHIVPVSEVDGTRIPPMSVIFER